MRKLFAAAVFLCVSLKAEVQSVQSNNEILQQARKEAAQELRKIITPEIIAAKYKIKWPAPKASSIAEAEKLVVIEAEKQFSRTHEVKTLTDFKEKAEEYYSPYLKGQKITIYKKNALGSNPRVEGKFYGVDSYGLVKIGNQRIPQIDINDRDLLRFFPEKASTHIKNYASNLEHQYNLKKRNALTQIKNQIRRSIYFQNGISTYRNKWIPTVTLVENMTKQAIQLAMNTKKNEIAAEIFTKNGYLQKGNKWVHPKIDYSVPDFDYEPKDLNMATLESIMISRNITVSDSPLAKHPGAKYYDFEF